MGWPVRAPPFAHHRHHHFESLLMKLFIGLRSLENRHSENPHQEIPFALVHGVWFLIGQSWVASTIDVRRRSR